MTNIEQYAKNLGKSFKHLALDITEEFIPGVGGLVRDSLDTMGAIKKSSSTSVTKAALYAVGNSTLGKETAKFTKATWRQLKTGEIYKSFDSMIGDMQNDILAEYGLGDFYDDSDNSIPLSDEEEKEYQGKYGTNAKAQPKGLDMKTIAEGDKLVAKATIDSAEASSLVIAKTLNTMTVENKAAMATLTSTVAQGTAETNAYLKTMVEFNNDVMKRFVEVSSKYYEENNSILEEMKNILYYAHPKKEAESSRKADRTWLDNINSARWKDFGKDVGGKVFEATDMTFFNGALGMLKGSWGMISKMIGDNPIGALASMFFIRPFIEKKFGLQMGQGLNLTEVFGEMLQTMFSKMSINGDGFMKNLGTIFNIKSSANTRPDVTEYDKGQIPFDGITKEAIVSVIPTYLSKILSALTDGKEFVYNYQKRRFMTHEQLASEFYDHRPDFKHFNNTFSNYISKGLEKDGVSKDVSPERIKKFVAEAIDAMSEKGYDLGMMSELNYDKMLNALGIDKSTISEKEYLLIASTLKRMRNDKQYKTFSRDYSKVPAKLSRYYKENLGGAGAAETGLLHLLDASTDMSSASATSDAMKNFLSNKKIPKELRQRILDANSTNNGKRAKRLEEYISDLDSDANRSKYDDPNFVPTNSSEASKSKRAMSSNLSDEQYGYISKAHSDSNIYTSFGQYLLDSGTLEKLTKLKTFVTGKEGSLLKELKSLDPNNLSLTIESKGENVTKFNSKVKELLSISSVGKLFNRYKKGVDTENVQANLSELTEAMNDIKDKDLSKGDKVKSATNAAASFVTKNIAESGIGQSVKGKFEKLKEWKEEKAPNLEKYLLAGTGAIIGGKALTSILAKMSGMGSVTSAFGMSTPVALASMGIAGAMWGGKKLIEGNLMGEMDVPKRKALLTKTIPSIVGGAGLFSILNRAGASILPFGEITAPVLAATLGIGFGLYSHKEDLFNKLMGKIKDKKGDKEGMKKMAKNFIWGGLATGLGVGGIKLMGGLTGTSDMLSSMYNSMGMLAPIGLATSAIAMGLLAKNKDINAKFFGMENRNTSFHDNMMNYLFGDSGIITKGKKKARDWFTDKQEKVAGWFKDSIAAPFKAALDPVADLTKHTLTNLKNSMVESFKSIPVKIGDTTVSLSEAFNQKILTPLGTFVTGITSKLGGWLGKIVSTPIKWLSNFFQNKAKNVRAKNGGYMSHEEKYRGYGLDMDNSDAKREQDALWGALDPSASKSNATAQPTRFTASDGTVLDNADDLKYYEEGLKSESGKGTSGGNIFYSQKDVKGTDSQFMRSEGCGIASAAMCLSMVHKEKITPSDLLPHAKNFRDTKGGVTLSFFESLSNKYDVPVGIYKRSELNVPTIDALLNKGAKLIALVQSGGTNKHYLVISDVNGNAYTILDPESKGPKKLSKHAVYGISTHIIVFYSDFKATAKNLNRPDISPDLEERTGDETNAKVKGVKISDRSKVRAGNQAEKLANSLTDTNINRTGNKIEAIGVKQTIGLRDDIKLLTNTLKGELGGIKREISYSLNGVSYNLEYIKRLLIENIGDTSNAPDTNLMKNKSFKAAKGRVANFFSKVFGGITDTVIGIKDAITMSANLFFDDMKAFGKNVMNVISAPFKFIGDKIGGFVKSMLAIPTSIYNGIKNIGSKMLDVTTEFAKQSIGVVSTVVKEGMSLGFDILKGSFRGLVDVGVEATKAVGTLVKSMADGSFFTNVASGMAKLGEQALKGLGYVIGGVGRGIGGIVSGIGNTIKGGGNLFGNIFDSVKNRSNEVYIKGGVIDKVALVDAIGAIGTVDVEHFREVYKKLADTDKVVKQEGVKNHLNSTELNVVNKEQNEGTNAEAKIVEKLDDIAKNTGGASDEKKPKKEKSGGIGQSIVSSMGGAGVASAVAAVVPAALSFLASAGGLYAVSKILKKAIFSKEEFIESQGKIMNNILGSNAGETIVENRRPTMIKAGVSTGVKLAGSTVKNGAKTLSTGIEAGHRIGIGAKKAFWDAPKAFLKKKGAKVASETTEAGLKNLDNVMTDEKVMGGLKKVVDVVGDKFVSLCNKFAPNLSARIVKFADKFMGRFGKKISESIASKGLKASAGVAFRQALGLLNSALAVWDAYKGWRDAHIYFGVEEDDCTIGMKMTAALTEFFINQMAGIPVIGLVIALCVPGDVVANFIYEFFASEDTIKELDSKRKDVDLKLSKENEVRVSKGEKPFKSKEEYLKHQSDNKEGWWSKLSKKHEKAVYGENTNTTAGFGSFISQKDSKFKNLDLSLGGEGATFDKAGCAPSTLMMALKDLGMEFDPSQLTELAKGYRHSKDTGVPINYISDVLKSKGVDTRTQVYNGTLDALSNISDGKNIILTTSENGTPHFVYTKGVDKNGRVILLDPLKQSERRVSADNPIISSAKMGLRVGGFGDMSQQATETPAVSQKSYGVMDFIKSILGSTFGDTSMFGSIFGSIFGNEDPTKDNPSYTGTDSKGVKPSSNYVVPEDKMMNVMLDQLKRHEGFRDRPYKCPANKLTIGYGFNMESGLFPKDTVQRWMSNGITVGEAEEVLKEEAIRIYNKFMEFEWFQNLDPTRKIAIVNMGFNMGTGGVMKFKNTINKMVNGDWEGAEKGILDSLYARQVPNRAKEIARMIRTGAYGNIKTQMKHEWDRDMNNLNNSIHNGKVRLERIPDNLKNRITSQLVGGTNDIGREITTSIDKGIQDTVNGLLYPSRTEATINRGGTADIFEPVNKTKKNRKGTADIFGYGSFGKTLLGGLEAQAKRSLNTAVGNVTGKVAGTVNRTVRKGTSAITDVVNSPIRVANKVVNQGLKSVDGVVNGVNKGVSKTISSGQKIIADTTKDALNGIIRGSVNPKDLELKGLPKHEINNLVNSELRSRNNTRRTIEEISNLSSTSKQLNVEKNISRDSIGGIREVVRDNGFDPKMLDKVGDKSVGAIEGMEKSVVAKLDTLINALTKFAEATIKNNTTVVHGGSTQNNYSGGNAQHDEFMGDILRIVSN